jgi:putative chitinase
MDKSIIFDAVREILIRRQSKGGFTGAEIRKLDDAIDRAAVAIVVIAPVSTKSVIDCIDVGLLKAAYPKRAEAALAPWVEPIKAACRKYDINTIRRISAFITTLAHEGGFIVGRRENMNFTAQRMSEVWPNRFAVGGKVRNGPNNLAKSLDRKPEEIANHVYANRMGNGPPESGDGWRYRGNGPPQLTGKANHQGFADALGITVEKASDHIATLEGGIEAAAWFWDTNDINRLADTPGISDETRRINGGEIGIKDRQKIFDVCESYLAKKLRS